MKTLILFCLLLFSSWDDPTGKYSYDEDWDNISGMVAVCNYTLEILNESEAIFKSAGYQTYYKVSCEVVRDGDLVGIYFVNLIDGLSYFKKGDLLFTLEFKNDQIYTFWGKVKPNISKKGNKFFVKDY